MKDEAYYVHIHFVNVMDEKGGNLPDYHFYISGFRMGRGGWIEPPPKGYKRARIDKPEGKKKHIHIYKNGEYVVINDDGSRRHGNGSIVIPKKLYDWIKKHFKDFDLPEDRVIQFKRMTKPKCKYSIVIDIKAVSVAS